MYLSKAVPPMNKQDVLVAVSSAAMATHLSAKENPGAKSLHRKGAHVYLPMENGQMAVTLKRLIQPPKYKDRHPGGK
jgi:hypothetical protein